MQMLLSIFALTSSATPSVILCQLQRFVYKQFTDFKVGESTDLEICNVLPVSELCKTPFFGDYGLGLRQKRRILRRDREVLILVLLDYGFGVKDLCARLPYGVKS